MTPDQAFWLGLGWFAGIVCGAAGFAGWMLLVTGLHATSKKDRDG